MIDVLKQVWDKDSHFVPHSCNLIHILSHLCKCFLSQLYLLPLQRFVNHYYSEVFIFAIVCAKV